MFYAFAVVAIFLIVLFSLIMTIQIGRNPKDERYVKTEKKRIVLLTSIYGISFLIAIVGFLIFLY